LIAAIKLRINPDNADQFFYDGPLYPGEFKFPVNRNTDWGQNMYMKDTVNDGHFYLHIGGEDDDLKWEIAEGEESRYHMVLDFSDLTIEINKIITPPAPDSLFIVGDASPNGWSIDQAIELTINPDNAYQFIYQGTLMPGEFKFPVNRNTDWAQDMYMRDTVNAGQFYLHIGGEADDNKWEIAEGAGGTYRVVLDFSDNTIEITLQTSLEDVLSGTSGFTVYPNPASEFLTIDLGEQESATAVFYSLEGRKLYQEILKSSTTTLDLNQVKASGILLLQISTVQNSEIVKVVVK